MTAPAMVTQRDGEVGATRKSGQPALVASPSSQQAVSTEGFDQAQHTPGPWDLLGVSERLGCFDVWARYGDGRSAIICSRNPWEHNAVQSIANAHLIAAAPDLLALAHQYRNDLLYPPAADSRERRIAAIDAVIAKVRGGVA